MNKRLTHNNFNALKVVIEILLDKRKAKVFDAIMYML